MRTRLSFWYSGILGLVLVLFGSLLYGVVRYQSLHHHDGSLRSDAHKVISILGREYDCATLTREQTEDLAHVNRLILVHDLEGRGEVLYRSPDFSPALVPHSEEEFRRLVSQPESFQTIEASSGVLRVYSVRYTAHSGRLGVVRVVDSLGDISESLATLRWALVITIPLCLVLAGAGGYWLAGRALRPVDEVTRLARNIGATNLRMRLPPPSTNDELGRLVDTFNQMIDRLERSFDSMRRFTADASHELRTPLTLMRSAIEVSLGRVRSADEYRSTLAALVESADRMNRILDDLLLLARADAGSVEMRREVVRLDELLFEVVESMRPLAETHGLGFSMDPLRAIRLMGDERWLRQMLYNLLDNAIKYTGKGRSVNVSLGLRDDRALVSIQDTGPGIPEEKQSHLFERFYRLDQARSRDEGGAGLGLSISLWIARSHGGDISVVSRAGEGSTFNVSLPLGGISRDASHGDP